MLKKEAKAITGGLSKPSKMPGPAYNLPATQCITGAKLVKIPGSVCHGCYALKGRYRFTNVRMALARRLESLKHPRWVEAMTVLIKGEPWFRWHDSGDLQSAWHLKRIFEVCNKTPETSHWLPTQERKLLQFLDPDIIPPNLIIRLSNAKNDTVPGQAWSHWSTVVSKPRAGHVCPAPEQGNNCGSCRACWNKDINEIQYRLH